MRNQNFGRNVRNLALRYLMICVFMFMCIPIISMNGEVFGPLLGTFYFIALIYYFWFTMKVEGEADVNRVKIGQAVRLRWKGAICALILAVPLMIVSVVPLFFHDPIPEEYQAYFTGKATVLTESDNFNQSLKKISGKDGYITEITFTEQGAITKIVYKTSSGHLVTSVAVSENAKEQSEAYYIDYTDENGKPQRVYHPLNPNNLSEEEQKKLEAMPEEFVNAFAECREGLLKVGDVKNAHPLANWQTAWNVVKMVTVSCLTYFCAIFAGNSVVISAVVYCVCMLILVAAAQVGYEMGYRNIEILRKKKPVKDSRAGDSVVIQRGRSSDAE